MQEKIIKEDFILEGETPEQAFKRIMNMDYDPEKYELRIGEGALDEGFDNPINTISIVEKENTKTEEQPAQEVKNEASNDEVLINYSNSGYGKNAYGWYFNPNIDEYDESYDPHNDPLFNKDLDRDEVLINYSNSGYGKNAYGWYFNPNIDEYDETYDPHNDPLFNKDIKKEIGNHDELFNEYAGVMNQMAEILGKEPMPGIENTELDGLIISDEDKEKFMVGKNRVEEIGNIDHSIVTEYADLTKQIADIRSNMGKIIGKEPYPGIETEYIHSPSLQLDDWEKDHFDDLRVQLDKIKEKYPVLFENVKLAERPEETKQEEQEQEQQVEAPVVDNNPQHQPLDNGYAQGGFQPPAVVVDNNPQHQPLDNGYAQGGFQPPAVVPQDNNPQHEPQDNGYAQGGFQPPAVVPEQVNDNQDRGPQTPQVDRRKELLKKSLIFAGGVVTGVGLSCVPGVGTIRMGIAAVKVTNAAVNVWANRHPDGRVAQLRQNILDHLPDRVKNGYVAISERLHSSPLNVFINGVSVGYIAGNVFELATGKTVFEAVQDKFQAPEIQAPAPEVQTHVQPEPKPTPKPTPQSTPATPDPVQAVVPDVPAAPDFTQIADAVKGGQTIDISGLEYGLVSSDATNAVHLIQSAGKDVTFLREVVRPDGTVMWAFNQSNGLGYAWFKADDVMDYLAKTGQELVSSGMTR